MSDTIFILNTLKDFDYLPNLLLRKLTRNCIKLLQLDHQAKKVSNQDLADFTMIFLSPELEHCFYSISRKEYHQGVKIVEGSLI
mmetsp:Transcript_10049/g.16928  ORF Transcript_10049/g.16928 Transcript_10049/m.16928 type:complete len:84 (+) Transcript_10049:591-842(+)